MHFGISAQVQGLREEFLQRGYVVIKRVFSEQLLDRYTAELAAFLLRSPEINSGQDNGIRHPEVTARRRAVQWHSAEVLQLAMDVRVMDTLRELLLEEPFLLHLGTPNHDDHNRRNFLTMSSATRHINAWIVLKDVKPESGPLWVAPESHHLTENHFDQLLRLQPQLAARWTAMRENGAPMDEWRQLGLDIDEASDVLLDTYMDDCDLERVLLMLKRGDVVIFSERLIHGRLNSTTADGARWCIEAQYGSFSHPRSRYFDTEKSDEN